MQSKRASKTLPVLVLAGSRSFASRLAAALGPNVMSSLFASDTAAMKKRIAQVPPAFVLIDASDVPAIDVNHLAEQLAALETEVVKAVWGVDLPYGASVLVAAQRRGITLTPFDRREGIEPLMDMIRSRRAQE